MRLGLIAAAGLLSCSTAMASLVMPEERLCLIGGEKFTAYVMVSMHSSGNRPDGRPYATSIPPPLVECPGNGFVYFRNAFSDAAKARLAPLVMSAEYQAMRKVETNAYRGWWLARAIPSDPYRDIGLLLAATWESDGQPERKARYQREFVAAATALPYSGKYRTEWTRNHVLAANALRELGEFRQSVALMAQIERVNRRASRQGSGIDADMERQLRGLRTLAAERNPAPEPANLIPVDEIAPRCVDGRTSLSASERRACATPEAQQNIAFFKANR